MRSEQGICEVAKICVSVATLTLLMLIIIRQFKCSSEAAILQIPCCLWCCTTTALDKEK
ncbi:MAG: tryptophan-rich sensory protein [Saprospiraceae bacterium]|nr:tryptophan-rich sensory protein [Saprospiraceae bacterium]MBK6477417.1 tryptophan-rich sensory protein [Saprospiraceae bacterium]MBK7371235.1 tryptophan-rich sensory protein [Saprospiraceae bacterium]MBL0109492.1 tryptophan-rich sensory protein [Saprospiraceae bacterium]MBP7803076.1 tryptophan-rich sensory protein [Saprospiraceae bacterium]